MEWAEWTNEKKLHAGWFVCYVYVVSKSVMLGGIMNIQCMPVKPTYLHSFSMCLPFITREVRLHGWMDYKKDLHG